MSPPPSPDRIPHDHAFVRAVLQRLLRDPQQVEDLAQETWLKVLRHSDASLVAKRAWLGTVARNLVRQHTRAETRRQRRERAVAKPVSQEPATLDEDRLERVREAIAQLPEHYRRVLHLRFYEDLPPTMIADRLEIPIETARTRLRRGLAALHAALVAPP